MKRRLAILAIGLLTMGTTSTILARAATAPAGAATACSQVKNKLLVDPNPAPPTSTGEIVRIYTGRCLVPGGSYILHDPECGTVNGPGFADLTGVFSGILNLGGCTPGTYYVTLTEDFGAHKVYVVKVRITSPSSCAPGSPATIDAAPHHVPRLGGVFVAQTLVGECYPAFAPVTVHSTACGGGTLNATSDAYGRFYVAFMSNTCFTTGSFPLTVTANFPPMGAILAKGIQSIDP